MGIDEKNRWHSSALKRSSSGWGRGGGPHHPRATRRLDEHGPNELDEGKGQGGLSLLIEQVNNPLIAVLALAAIISLLANKTIDAIVIFAVICINTFLGFYKEYKAEEAILALQSQASPEARVLRDCPVDGPCQETRIKARELVPGDVILLEAGAKVPADARIMEAANLEADESMLTGESVPARKKADALAGDLSIGDRENVLFAGTIVTQGRAKALVFSTGMATEMGKIAGMITRTGKTATPLKGRTLDLSKKLMILALVASSVTLVAGLLRGFEFIELALFTLAMAVSAIPEGLPAVITVTLAVGVSRMAERNAIIRKLDAVEALGSVTAICTDKTGTLTTNQMTVQKIFLGKGMVDVLGRRLPPEGEFQIEGRRIDPPGIRTYPPSCGSRPSATTPSSRPRRTGRRVGGRSWRTHRRGPDRRLGEGRPGPGSARRSPSQDRRDTLRLQQKVHGHHPQDAGRAGGRLPQGRPRGDPGLLLRDPRRRPT
jgi:Ca2+-transporting ATPase